MKCLILIAALLSCMFAMSVNNVDAQAPVPPHYVVHQSSIAGSTFLEFHLAGDGSAQLYDYYTGTVVGSGYSWMYDADGNIYIYDYNGTLVLALELNHTEEPGIDYYTVLYSSMYPWITGDACTGLSSTIIQYPGD